MSKISPGYVIETVLMPPKNQDEFVSRWKAAIDIGLEMYPEVMCNDCKTIITQDESYASELLTLRESNFTGISRISIIFRCIPCAALRNTQIY